jgi:alpha-ribazole phosphatase/probable phosphoglycerate mutase
MVRRRVFLVRHGVTEWNAQSRFQGRSDIPLSEEGRRQARCLAHRFAGRGPFRVHTSPLARAFETASILCSFQEGTVPRTWEGLSEMCFGMWEGRVVQEIRTSDPERFSQWRQDPFGSVPPGGETFSELQARVREVLDEILRHDGPPDVIVSHGGVVRAALVSLLHLPPEVMWRMRVGNCSVSCVEFSKEWGASLVFLNDELHVLTEGERELPFPA